MKCPNCGFDIDKKRQDIRDGKSDGIDYDVIALKGTGIRISQWTHVKEKEEECEYTLIICPKCSVVYAE